METLNFQGERDPLSALGGGLDSLSSSSQTYSGMRSMTRGRTVCNSWFGSLKFHVCAFICLKPSPYKDVPWFYVDRAHLMKRNRYKDILWPMADAADLMKRSSHLSNAASLVKRNSYKDMPWPSEGYELHFLKRSPYKDVPRPPEGGVPPAHKNNRTRVVHTSHAQNPCTKGHTVAVEKSI